VTRRILAATVLAAALLAGCRRSAPELPGVRLFASADLPAEVVRDAAARLGVARVTRVPAAEDAEVAWTSDPVAALALGARLVPGSAPAPAGVGARWTDPRGRFAPATARARVLLVSPAARLPLEPTNLRDLADPRLRGRVALVHPGRGAGPVTVAALSITYGEASAGRFLRLLAANAPRVVGSDAEVRAAVASGAAAVGLAGSVDGAAGAASALALRVVYPDQTGRGALVLPTAVAVLSPPSGGAPAEGAARFAAWLASPDAERLLVARVPGLLPLRPEVPIPVGVEPANDLASLSLDWDRLAEETARLAPMLERWPDADGASGHAPH
jgi:iron(III) transport system substrate-binding protein